MDELARAARRQEGAGVNERSESDAYPSRRAPSGALLRMRSAHVEKNRLILRSLAQRGVAKDAPQERHR